MRIEAWKNIERKPLCAYVVNRSAISWMIWNHIGFGDRF